jgi:hypothetical protein
MMRVHDRLPVQELPMIVPSPRARPDEAPGLSVFQNPGLGTGGQQQDPVGNLLRNLLGETR